MANIKYLSPLLSATELKTLSKIVGINKSIKILEAGVGKGVKKSYDEGHINEAVFVDTLKCNNPTPLLPRPLPEMKCFQEYASNLGISNAHHLVIYDRSPFGFYASSRMWWIFRLFGHEKVSILNGGLNAWINNGFELTTKVSDFKKENFWIVGEKKELKRDFNQIEMNIKCEKEQVIDVRGANDFQMDNIPNSKNIPYNNLFDQTTGLLKSKDELLRMFKEKEIDKPIIASCMTGMTATSLAFAAYLVGLKNTSVYYGSWTEYSQKTE